MKIRERKVTRNITFIEVTAKVYNDSTDEVTTEVFNLVGVFDEKEIKEILTTKTEHTILKILNVNKTEERFEQTEEEFVRNGSKSSKTEQE